MLEDCDFFTKLSEFLEVMNNHKVLKQNKTKK